MSCIQEEILSEEVRKLGSEEVRVLKYLPYSANHNNRQTIRIEAFKGTHPLAPSLKKGGGMSTGFPSETNPSLFQGGEGVGT